MREPNPLPTTEQKAARPPAPPGPPSLVRQGWQCPLCNRIYSPIVVSCGPCNEQTRNDIPCCLDCAEHETGNLDKSPCCGCIAIDMELSPLSRNFFKPKQEKPKADLNFGDTAEEKPKGCGTHLDVVEDLDVVCGGGSFNWDDKDYSGFCPECEDE